MKDMVQGDYEMCAFLLIREITEISHKKLILRCKGIVSRSFKKPMHHNSYYFRASAMNKTTCITVLLLSLNHLINAAIAITVTPIGSGLNFKFEGTASGNLL
ncbi:hypothetical protein DDZ13_03650 [Coraliomargarita sinensis]|uniref:Uncharacterized protein n=1 Tax=Coraliomargarita sinensis TaxID=2174842 RepID=A0A317ZP00_9BACT|nr:hypothetical protein DDZ13_03650 [Coraliomargarita sinensis]